ncbi:MAG TPA: discoidin domain-containing protein, partial [Acidimicrobiales bacterium]|nr:discoidin domain-containing protein [Acidimicrobiales bacterium]
GTLDTDQSRLRQLMQSGATLVVTDTNRKEAFRWDTLAANYGSTETPSQNPQTTDLSDSPIELFPHAGIDAKSIASYVGAVSVDASSYGNSVSYTPEDRAYSAIDGNLDTNWETGTFVPDPKGQWWQIKTSRPVTTDHITLVQPLTGDISRWITKVKLSFDGSHPLYVNLGPSSRTPTGQIVPFSTRTFRTLRITIESTSDNHASTKSAAAVGFAEVEIPGVHVLEVIDMPSDLLSAAGTASLSNRLVLSMTRERVSPFPPRDDPETNIVRQFTLPTSRTFSLSGTASISPLIPDDEIDRLVGRSGFSADGIVAYSEGRLPGDLKAGAAAAIDGNPATAWEPGLGIQHVVGSWMQFDLPRTISFDHLNLQIIADGLHSVPTSITIDNGNGEVRTVHLPAIPDRHAAGATASVPVQFPAITGNRFRFTITSARLEYSPNYFSYTPLALPVGIAELGIPGVQIPPVPSQLPGTCQANLLSIDGKPIDVRVVGSTATALENGEMPVEPCGPDANGITLGAGTHLLQTAIGHTTTTGWNLDQLVFDSAPGGRAASPLFGAQTNVPVVSQPTTTVSAPTPGPVPTVSVISQNSTGQQLRVSGASGPFELVFGQSLNAGWKAVASPAAGARSGSHSVTLGSPELVDAFANGWHLDSSQLAALGATGTGGTGTFEITLTWAPQRAVWAALLISAITVAVCIVLVLLGFRRRRRAAPRHASTPSPRASSDRGPATPRLTLPGIRRVRRPRWWLIPIISVVTGGVAAAISAPLVGAAAAGVTALVLAVPVLRAASALIALGFLVAAVVSVVGGQAMHPVAMSSNWPSTYEAAGTLTWIAVVFLGVDAVTERSMRAR